MAIDMSQVKSIQIPEGSVSQITDSQNRVLWYNPTYPYRRLQYIESTGTQAIDTGVACARNSYLKLYVEDTSNNTGAQQHGRGAVANAQRFAAGYSEGKYFFGLGNGWITGNAATTDPHMLGVQGPECHILDHQIWGSGGQQGYLIDNTFTNNSNTYPASSITFYSTYLLGSRGDTSGSIQGPVSCKLYYAELGYSNTSTHNIGYNRRMYPVQRKSDNAIGLYDLQSNSFYTIGANQTALTAGPVINEYFDTTVDPSIKQTYTNSSGFVIPKGTNQTYESIDLITLDDDIDYITFSAHLYHQAVGADGTKTASIGIYSQYAAGGTNTALSNTSTSATTENPSNIRIEIQHSDILVRVFAKGTDGLTIAQAYEEIYYDKPTRTLKLRRFGDSNAKTRIEITNIKIDAHKAF